MARTVLPAVEHDPDRVHHRGIVAADGGSNKALALLFFIPVVFAALSYPLASGRNRGPGLRCLRGGGSRGRTAGSRVRRLLRALPRLHGSPVRLARPEPGPPPRGARARVARRPPTGCSNRRGFEERFDAELSRALRSRPVGLVLLDLDHFKEVNDTRGHAAGDEMLRWAVDVMDETVRPMDTIGRVGDEFAVILPGAGPDDSAVVAGRIQRALEARAPASAGVAVFPTDGADRDELQRSADAKLYVGKRGRATPIKMTAKELSHDRARAGGRRVDGRAA